MKTKITILLVIFLLGITTTVLAGKPDRNKSPNAVASANQTIGNAPLAVQFTGSSSSDPDGYIAAYFWNFGDGSTSILANPEHTYNDVGSYVASLVVTDDKGATGTDTITITANEPPLPPPDIPKKMRFQGKLEDEYGPVAGNTTVIFKIYNTTTGGTVLWSESQQIDVEDGMVDTLLNLEGADLTFTEPYYLGVNVNSDGEMTPRFEMTTAPYAFTSER